MKILEIIGGIILLILFLYGEYKMDEEDREYFNEFGVYPSREGWD